MFDFSFLLLDVLHINVTIDEIHWINPRSIGNITILPLKTYT